MIVGKFDRTYKLDIKTPTGIVLTISPPFSIKFNVKRDTLSSANKTKVTITNLGETTRNQIYKDRYSTTEYWQMTLQAGYNSELSTIFQGNIYEAYSVKQGTQWITTIDGYDGMHAIQNGFVNQTIAANSDGQTVVDASLTALPNISAGAITQAVKNTQILRGQVLFGSPLGIMQDTLGVVPYIDNEKLYILNETEALTGQVVKLDSSDLLETPIRRETFIVVKALFQPRAAIKQIYEIDSIEKKYNGQYAVQGIQHDVEISGATSGKAITTLQMFYGAAGFEGVS